MSLPEQPLSPLDGRYRSAVSALGEHLSEAGLNRARVRVEVEWLLYLTDHELFGSVKLDHEQARQLREFAAEFGQAEIDELAELEATTRHDVKAVEYLVRRKLSDLGLTGISELTHFACTSEDINNLSYALTISAAVREVWLPKFRSVIAALRERAIELRDDAMLAHTHGQPATPTTMGKELAVFVYRLDRILTQIEATEYLGKFSGATGTFAAHLAADATQDWPAISNKFVTSLGLTWNPLTTQIESHDWQAELYSRISHANRVLHNLCTDVWTYISMGYFRQIPQPGATGSSTMPHKINPIRFENAEANLEVSNALFDVLGATLVQSRLQRDLTDSSMQRNIGTAFGHSLLAIDNATRGLAGLDAVPAAMAADLDANWEVLGEPIQSAMRALGAQGVPGMEEPYERLKELTRGRRIGQAELVEFVRGLGLPAEVEERLAAMTPATYVGLAPELVDHLR